MTATATTASGKFEAYGKACWLWSSSPLHRGWSALQQARFVLPAIESGQFHILEENGMPVAYCSWAFMTLEAEARYILDPGKLEQAEWSGGDRLWFIDWIAPFHRRHTLALTRLMTRRFSTHVGRSYSVRAGKEKGRIATFIGKDLDGETSRAIRRRYHLEVMEVLRRKQESDPSFTLRMRG